MVGACLTLKEKNKFFSDGITFLDYHINKRRLHILKEKVKVKAEVSAPQNVQEIKAFLGLINVF